MELWKYNIHHKYFVQIGCGLSHLCKKYIFLFLSQNIMVKKMSFYSNTLKRPWYGDYNDFLFPPSY